MAQNLYFYKNSTAKLICLLIILFLSNSAIAQTCKENQQKIWSGVGGKSNWEKTRYLTFSFSVINSGKKVFSRKHVWDRYSGDYRLEYIGKDSSKIISLFNVNTKKGEIFRDGKLIENDTLKQNLLKKSYNSFINDTYWLLMPVKLEDLGVVCTPLTDTVINSVLCHRSGIRFETGIGNTSGDYYEIFINSKNNEIIRWKYLLEGDKESEIYDWKPYEDIGGLQLSLSKKSLNKEFEINMEDAKILEKLDLTVFSKP